MWKSVIEKNRDRTAEELISARKTALRNLYYKILVLVRKPDYSYPKNLVPSDTFQPEFFLPDWFYPTRSYPIIFSIFYCDKLMALARFFRYWSSSLVFHRKSTSKKNLHLRISSVGQRRVRQLKSFLGQRKCPAKSFWLNKFG